MQSATRCELFGAAGAWVIAIALPLPSHAQSGKPAGAKRYWPLDTPRRTGIHDFAPAPVRTAS